MSVIIRHFFRRLSQEANLSWKRGSSSKMATMHRQTQDLSLKNLISVLCCFVNEYIASVIFITLAQSNTSTGHIAVFSQKSSNFMRLFDSLQQYWVKVNTCCLPLCSHLVSNTLAGISAQIVLLMLF